mgnify:CR=1 FL=1
MEQLPITSNTLGLNKSQRLAGAMLVLSAVLVGALVLLRALTLSDQDWEQVSPRRALVLCAVAVSGVFALRRLYVGMHVLLEILVDAAGPAVIEQEQFAIRELIFHRRIWTYRKPHGLIEKVCCRLFRGLLFLTPPYRGLLDGFSFQVLVLVVAGGCVVYCGVSALPLASCVLFAILGRLSALGVGLRARIWREPPVDVYEQPEHLTEAGNPLDLYHQLRLTLEKLREGGFQNRVITDSSSGLAPAAEANKFTADLLVETQPMSVDGSHRVQPAIWISSLCGVALEATGFGLLLFTGTWAGTPQAWAFSLAAAAGSIWYGARFLFLSQAIQYTFRFRSDLLWLHFDGTYLLNKLAVGGGLTGLPSAEGQSLKSDLWVFVRAARVITECSPMQAGVGRQLWSSSQPAETVLQRVPRYVVSSQLDPVLAERLAVVVNNLRSYRDQADDLRTPDLRADRMSQMLQANVQITQMLNVASAFGAAHGANLATDPTSGGPSPLALPAPPHSPPRLGSGPATKSPAVPTRRAPTAPTPRTPPPPAPSSTGRKPPGSAVGGQGAAQPRGNPKCLDCGQSLPVPPSTAGAWVKCPNCGRVQPFGG